MINDDVKANRIVPGTEVSRENALQLALAALLEHFRHDEDGVKVEITDENGDLRDGIIGVELQDALESLTYEVVSR